MKIYKAPGRFSRFMHIYGRAVGVLIIAALVITMFICMGLMALEIGAVPEAITAFIVGAFCLYAAGLMLYTEILSD